MEFKLKIGKMSSLGDEWELKHGGTLIRGAQFWEPTGSDHGLQQHNLQWRRLEPVRMSGFSGRERIIPIWILLPWFPPTRGRGGGGVPGCRRTPTDCMAWRRGGGCGPVPGAASRAAPPSCGHTSSGLAYGFRSPLHNCRLSGTSLFKKKKKDLFLNVLLQSFF